MRKTWLIFGAALILLNCGTTKLTKSKVQTGVDKALDWTKKGGSVQVVGIQEIPQENSALRD